VLVERSGLAPQGIPILRTIRAKLAGSTDVRAILTELLRAVKGGVRPLEEARWRVAVEELGDAAGEPKTLFVGPERRTSHRVVDAPEEVLPLPRRRPRADH